MKTLPFAGNLYPRSDNHVDGPGVDIEWSFGDVFVEFSDYEDGQLLWAHVRSTGRDKFYEIDD